MVTFNRMYNRVVFCWPNTSIYSLFYRFFTMISVNNTLGFNSATSSCKAEQIEHLFLVSSSVAWIMARILKG